MERFQGQKVFSQSFLFLIEAGGWLVFSSEVGFFVWAVAWGIGGILALVQLKRR